MKILAVGRNYVEHIEELKNERPENPVIFTKPDTALSRYNKPFYYPDFSTEIHFEVELVLRVSKIGKNIQEKFANTYYDAIAVGIDFTARDLQNQLINKGMPWTLSKGFDGSAPISEFIPLSDIKDIKNINFSLFVDGNLRQKGNSGLMIFNFDHIVTYISRFITIKKGDIIFTGTPKGVGPVKIGNKLEAFLENKKMLEIEIR
ncbi:MAG TPA: fumarylacetoacetate hydrolase family protein [Cyclobacteriaceae bacterium]|nr:fumarylacetoacetate hydrolase family protein [Cyclobacteriaceae bacterium]